jgi:hypothetical protein
MDDLCTLCLFWALGGIFPWFFSTFFQTALILISGKDGVMDLIYGGYSSDDAHISGITNDTLNLDSR